MLSFNRHFSSSQSILRFFHCLSRGLHTHLSIVGVRIYINRLATEIGPIGFSNLQIGGTYIYIILL